MVAPRQERIRASGSPCGESTNTLPSEACATSRLPAASTAMPSGPLVPWKEAKRPTLAVLPSGSSGRRQTALSRVMATNSTSSSGESAKPFGLGPLASRQSSRPSGRSRYTRPVGSCSPVCPWSVK